MLLRLPHPLWPPVVVVLPVLLPPAPVLPLPAPASVAVIVTVFLTAGGAVPGSGDCVTQGDDDIDRFTQEAGQDDRIQRTH